MNLGLAMIKPAESDLGLAMRLWLANQASWKLRPPGWDERVAVAIARNQEFRKITLPESAKGLSAVRHLQSQLLNKKGAALPASDALRLACDSTSRRNCPECARLGYHCVYYDYPWLERCPVHELPLVRHCPDCSSLWPSPFDVHCRDCACCGIRKRIETLIEHGAFETVKFSDTLTPLDLFFRTPIQLVQSSRSFIYGVRNDRHDRFARTSGFPSVLATHAKLDEDARSLLVDHGLDLQPCHKRFVKVDATTQPPATCHEHAENELVNQCRARIFRLATRALKSQAGHTLGTCRRDPIHLHYDCVYCESWRQWTRGFEQVVEKRHHQCMLSYHPPYARRVRVRDPGLVSTLVDHETATRYQLHKQAQRLIYQVELWLCFRKMMLQIEFYLSRPFDPRESYVSYTESDRAYLSHEQHHFGYFYFVKENEEFTLIFPKAYVGNSLNNHESLLSLFREPV